MNRLSLSISCVQFKYLSGMREREWREGERGINWTTTWYQVESYSFLHDENGQFSSLSSSSSQSDIEGYHFFSFGQLKWIISFQFNHHFLFLEPSNTFTFDPIIAISKSRHSLSSFPINNNDCIVDFPS